MNSHTIQVKQFQKHLEGIKTIVIIPHKDPDGDAIGAALAWYNVLIQKGYTIIPVTPNEVPESLLWMNGSDQIIDYRKQREQAVQVLNRAQLLLFLDFNNSSRLGDMKESVAGLKVPVMMIDHHPNPDKELADVMISDTSVSSTCELSYEVMKSMGFLPNINTAECLYTGIMTDTGMLNHNSSHPELYHTVAELLETGMDKEKVHKEVFHSNSLTRMQLVGHALCNGLTMMLSGKVAYIALSKNDLEKYQYRPGDTEDLVNYPLSIDGVEVAALITEKDEQSIKISLRSRGGIPVNKYAEKYFNGGGHLNAAGGELKDNFDKALSIFTQTIDKVFLF